MIAAQKCSIKVAEAFLWTVHVLMRRRNKVVVEVIAKVVVSV